MEHIFGGLTLALAVAMVALALPSQIQKNRSEGRCGVSFLMAILPLGVYVSRLVYALLIGSYYIAIPDAVGAVFAGIIFGQYFWYRRTG